MLLLKAHHKGRSCLCPSISALMPDYGRRGCIQGSSDALKSDVLEEPEGRELKAKYESYVLCKKLVSCRQALLTMPDAMRVHPTMWHHAAASSRMRLRRAIGDDVTWRRCATSTELFRGAKPLTPSNHHPTNNAVTSLFDAPQR
jgi:hypothetical protein